MQVFFKRKKKNEKISEKLKRTEKIYQKIPPQKIIFVIFQFLRTLTNADEKIELTRNIFLKSLDWSLPVFFRDKSALH